MPENNIANEELSFRGPLKYVVETSAPQLEAGRNTTIFLLITNPYDVPVKIVSAQTKVPVEFKDSAAWIPLWKRLWEKTKDEADLDGLQLVSGVALNDEKVSLNDGNKNGETQSQVILQPGNTTIYEFRLRTKQALFFTPAVHNLNAQVQYEMDGITNHDTVKYQLNIRAPLKALICGSVVGSIVGTILRNIKDGRTELYLSPVKNFLPFIVSILVGTVLVIAFARKKDAQPFITIEDFWGGFFIGFLAGYVGESLLETVVIKSGNN